MHQYHVNAAPNRTPHISQFLCIHFGSRLQRFFSRSAPLARYCWMYTRLDSSVEPEARYPEAWYIDKDYTFTGSLVLGWAGREISSCDHQESEAYAYTIQASGWWDMVDLSYRQVRMAELLGELREAPWFSDRRMTPTAGEIWGLACSMQRNRRMNELLAAMSREIRASPRLSDARVPEPDDPKVFFGYQGGQPDEAYEMSIFHMDQSTGVLEGIDIRGFPVTIYPVERVVIPVSAEAALSRYESARSWSATPMSVFISGF